MGIPGESDPFGQDCPLCFPTGEAPSIVYAQFSGMSIGAGGFPPPEIPNWLLPLEQIPGSPACTYLFDDGTTNCFWRAINGTSFLGLGPVAHHGGWFKDNKPICTRYFTNDWNHPPANGCWGGYGMIYTRRPSGADSMFTPANLLNMEIEKETFTQFWPKSNEETVVRYARKKDSSCVYIKMDVS